MSQLSQRRTFLQTAAGLALLAAGCSSSKGGGTRTAPPPLRPSSTPAGPADWTALGRGLRGKLVRPGDADYALARRLYQPRYDRIRPAGVVYAANPADVQECVKFASRYGIVPVARSGGHSYTGWSTGTGLVVDVSSMNRVSAAGGRATIGAGARMVDVYDTLADQGVSVPAGSCPTVGIAGLVLGGGIGVVSRAYGLTCDVMESIRIVTPDGRLLDCHSGQHTDLYWACRGGGGGNFGMAVEFTFRTHPTQDVTTFFVRWPWARAAALIRAWQDWSAAAPDEVWSTVHLDTAPGEATPAVEVAGLALGDSTLDKLVAAVGAEPTSRLERSRSYQSAMMLMAGCQNMTVEQCHEAGELPGQRPGGRFPRTDYTAKSHVMTRPLPADAADALVARFTQANDLKGRSVLLDALGGAAGRPGPADTAFPHRSGLFTAQYIAPVTDLGWLRGTHGAMAPYAGGTAYVNYPDPELAGWQRAYYGANYDRLRKVKAAYDPEGLLRFPQSIS